MQGKLTDVTGRINSSNARRAHTNPVLKGVARCGLLVILAVVADLEGGRPRDTGKLEGLGLTASDALRQGRA
jgi:hypothetical protein